MPCCLHISPLLNNVAMIIQKKGRTNHSDTHLTIILFLTNNSELIMKHFIRIRNEIDSKRTWNGKLSMGSNTITRNSYYLNSKLSKILLQTCKIHCLLCTPWRIIFGIKIEESTFILSNYVRESHLYELSVRTMKLVFLMSHINLEVNNIMMRVKVEHSQSRQDGRSYHLQWADQLLPE